MRYLKVRKETASYLGLMNTRCTIPADGSYILYDRDVAHLQGSGTLEELLPEIGGVELSPAELRAEQLGETQPAGLPEVRMECIIEHRISIGSKIDRDRAAASGKGAQP